MNISRVSQERQVLLREIWRENVLKWLNNELPKEEYSKFGKARIASLVDALIHLCRESRKRGRNRSADKELNRWAVKVNELIERYPSCKIVGWDPPYHRLSFGDDFSTLRLKGATEVEAGTAYSAIGLAELDALEGLIKCSCGRWFLARQRNQKSCSAICRHRLYEKTDAFKAKRRKYMKEYNRLKASGKVK
jgi:hypothetical protein